MNGEAIEVSEGIYTYIQPNGTWYLNNTGFLVGSRGVVSIDVGAAFADMVSYNGGRPLACHA
jgi:cyclase